MSYPYGQPGYPAGGPGYPNYGRPPGYPAPPPGGGTAITAGVLALVFAVLATVGMIVTIVGAGSLSRIDNGYGDTVDNSAAGVLYVVAVVEAVFALLWAVGGILLLNRRNAGRVMLIVMSCLGLVGGLIGIIAGAAHGTPASAVGSVFGMLVAALLLGLSAAGSTKRWIDARAQPPYAAVPQQPYDQQFYAQQPYGQPQYPYY